MRAAPRLFLDANIWIAAAGSRTGASALVLALCQRGHATAVSSRLILLEVERNIQAKLGPDALRPKFTMRLEGKSALVADSEAQAKPSNGGSGTSRAMLRRLRGPRTSAVDRRRRD